MVAFSTFSMAKLAKSVFDEKSTLFWLFIFFFCLVFVYIPSLFARVFSEAAKYESFKRYIELFKQRYFNCVPARNDHEFNETREPYLKSEGWHLTSCTIDNITGLLTYFLSITLNILIIGHEVSFYILPAYICSLTFSSIIIYTTKYGIRKRVDSEQSSRVSLSKLVIDASDNIIIGNTANYFSWNKNFHEKINISKECNKKMVVFKEMVASASIFIAIIPVILMDLYVFSTSADKKLLVVMLALLPRKIQITHYISDLVHFVIVFLDTMERNKGLLGSLKEYNFPNIEKKINWGSMKIRFNDEEIRNIHSLHDFENTIKSLTCGRFLIKGENGSGKTVLLSMLKHHFGEHAVFLPCDARLHFTELDSKNLSSGERSYNYLKLIATQQNTKIYLLDEWDANLDKFKIKEVEGLINKLSKSKIVIEVRHRGS